MSESMVQNLNHLLYEFYLPLRDQVQNQHVAQSLVCEHNQSKSGLQLNERFLQILWNEQCFNSPLHTVGNRPLEVITPGTWNVEAGPDFRDAILMINGRNMIGDVEIHQHVQDWAHHGHDQDARYKRVVLHVVWETATVADVTPAIPLFAMSDFLQRPWRTLIGEIQAHAYSYAQKVYPGACAVTLALADDDNVKQLLQVAGLARFQAKSAYMQRQIIAKGAGQALYEAIFEALGYKANRQSFRHLAEVAPLAKLEKFAAEADMMEAVLFGRAKLLPDPSRNHVTAALRPRVRLLWDLWWQTGEASLELTWSRAGIRPLNSPERRLAAGVEFLRRVQLKPHVWLHNLVAGADCPRDLLRKIGAIFEVRNHWECYSNFSNVLSRPAKLLGSRRVADISVNVVLPYLNAVAVQQGDNNTASLVQEAFLLMPKLQHNRLLDEAIHRYFVPASRARALLRSAACQQGLLELYQSFCLVLHADCKNCPLLSSFQLQNGMRGNTVSSSE